MIMKHLYFLVLFIPFFTFSQSMYTISGVIKDNEGKPIPYVNITLDRDNKYAISKEDGTYEIKKVRAGNYILKISSVGYTTISRKVTINTNTSLHDTLEDSVENLDDVIVSGKKASTRQKEQAISIGSFELTDVISQTNIITDQIDKISGVRIRRSGSLGDNSDVSINGLNGTAVRIYIDGIPLEFLYPRLDLATLPLTNIKRVDVYKGVLPIDISTDALGGGINIVTENKKANHLKASYSLGSFNTHLGDLSLTLVDKKDNFLNVGGGVNYSDNDYTFKADLLVNNPLLPAGAPPVAIENQNIRRFHDQYRLQHTNMAIGTSNKKWTDNAQISLNYLRAYREAQNAFRISNIAIGEAFSESESSSVIVKYDKTLLKNKLQLKTISNYSHELIKFVDTTANAYNWLGDIIFRNASGEFTNGSPALVDTKTQNYVNRTSLNYNIDSSHKLLLSNIIAYQKRDIKDFDINNPIAYSEVPTQKITKNISGLQYEGKYLDNKIKLTATAKYYNFKQSSLDFRSNEILDLEDDFFGWNGAIKYQVVPDLALRVSYERGFLIPEIFQFAGNATGVVSNASIKPEESDNYNLGFLFSKNFNEDFSVFLTANAFLRKQKNIIFLNTDVTPLQYVNAENVEAKGIEGELKFKFLSNFNWVTNVSYIEKNFISFTNGGIQNDFLKGSPFPNTPSFFYNTQLNWSKENIFNSNIDVNIYAAYSHVDAFNFIIVGEEQTIENSPDLFIPNNNRIDAGFSVSFLNKKITTAFNIVNITDEELFDNFSIPRPGRNFNFKLIYELSNF